MTLPKTQTPKPLQSEDIAVPRYYRAQNIGSQSLSRERIRQIETIAMRKMRREFARRGVSKDQLLG